MHDTLRHETRYEIFILRQKDSQLNLRHWTINRKISKSKLKTITDVAQKKRYRWLMRVVSREVGRESTVGRFCETGEFWAGSDRVTELWNQCDSVTDIGSCEIEEGLTSHWTHYRSFRGRVFYESNDPTNSVKSLKEVEVLRIGFNPTRSTSPRYKPKHAYNTQ